jgi:hypothetical protein
MPREICMRLSVSTGESQSREIYLIRYIGYRMLQTNLLNPGHADLVTRKLTDMGLDRS